MVFLHRIYFMPLYTLNRAVRYLFFACITVFFPACVTMRHCSIETLQPAKLTFEGPKKNIAICTFETVLSESIKTEETAIEIQTDSLISNILHTLQRSWEEAPGFEDTQFYVYIIHPDELFVTSNYDFVVLLDNLMVRNSYYGQQYTFFEWEAYLYVQYLAKWSVRNNSGALIDEYTDRDLIMWSSGIHEGKFEAVEQLPEIKDAWWDMGIALAHNYAARIAPQWQTGTRNIYMVNKFPELSQRAYTAIQNEAYTRASNIWEAMLLSCRKRGQKNIKSQINYNMAVAYEFQNQLDEAIIWTQRSINLKQKSKTVAYLKLLRERQQYQIQLDMQTSIMEPDTQNIQ